MSSSAEDVRVLLNQAAGFARRENFADAVARARQALSCASAKVDSVGVALASQALAAYTRSFEAWNEGIAARRILRTERAAVDERTPLPPLR